ncbi:MAG: acetyl-CoA carboxylase biotin carboxylase subunit [Chloroflexi bacterium]|nr:acetyl-CoA carboxylase biotin carboxylase subunit [Chloroflexota bacterium]
MFTKVLIANRGEIAVRIIRTCRELGVATVAVYSEADRTALHVQMADESYPIGPAPATKSYLRIDRIIEAARRSGAQAVHPGYGFLAEHAAFAQACADAGLVFIGPSPQAIRLLGDKAAAKALARSVGVPLVPGYYGQDQSDDLLLAEARATGFPVLIKAAAGGGGKGMRAVATVAEFPEALVAARREALAAFGDGTVLLERYLPAPRHIEVQVLGDHHGHLIHLGERECSIQRRHQKVLEECPSPALTPDLRDQLGAAAVRVAQAAGYHNAGTVEFLLDAEGNWAFLEMNTRLQVEHPVTEAVTGLDLVRLQLLVAARDPLPLRQEDVALRGHAIEARLYAEDPARDYLPSVGRLACFVPPEGVRNDVGVFQGAEVTPYYDPLLAKLIVAGRNRDEAVARLREALDRYRVEGVTTNLGQLRAIVAQPDFQAGRLATDFLARVPWRDRMDAGLPAEALVAAAAWELAQRGLLDGRGSRSGLPVDPWRALGPWRHGRWDMELAYRWEGRTARVVVGRTAGGQGWTCAVDGEPWEVEIDDLGEGRVQVRRGAQVGIASGRWEEGALLLTWAGRDYLLEQPDAQGVAPTAASRNGLGERSLTSPLPGRVVRVAVREGEIVAAQQRLVILEAMKMEHTIAAPYPGTVRRVLVREGDQVPAGTVLVELEPAA